MTRRDPLRGITWLIVDGSNQREPSSSRPVSEGSVVGGLRAVIPAGIEIHVVFDTDPPIGSATVRRVGGVTIHHARAGGGDDAIVRLAGSHPTGTLVVSDDRELRTRVAEVGAEAERNDWLGERRRLRRAPAPPPRREEAADPLSAAAEGDEETVRRWRPGRGATVKRGNPRRHAKRR